MLQSRPSFSILVEKYGGEPIVYGIVADSLDAMKSAINDLGGYDTTQTGRVEWVN